MKKLLLLIAAGALALSSCSQDSDSVNSEGQGNISLRPSVNLDAKDLSTRANTPLESFAGYRIELTGAEQKTIDDIPSNGVVKGLTPGQYTVRLTNYPEDFTPAFNAPYYDGSSSATVSAGKTETVNMTLEQANAGVFFVYTQLADTELEGVVPSINQGATTLEYKDGNSDAIGYFAAGDATVTFALGGETINVGGSASNSMTLAAGELWEVTLNPVSDGTGGISISATIAPVTPKNEEWILSPDASPGKLTADVAIPNSSKFTGNAIYGGTGSGFANWQATLVGEGLTLTDGKISGSGYAFKLDLYSDANSHRLLRGIYQNAEAPKAFGFTPGSLATTRAGQSYEGSWFFIYEDGKIVTHAPIISGNINSSGVSIGTSPDYEFRVNLVNDEGFKITSGKFATPVTFTDAPTHAPIVFTSASGDYWGDSFRSGSVGSGEYTLKLSSRQGGVGFDMNFAIFAALANDPNEIFIRPGVYTLDTSMEIGTALKGKFLHGYKDFTLFNYHSSTVLEYEFIESGTVDVRYSNKVYDITFDLVTNHGEQLSASYHGGIVLKDLFTPQPVSKLTEDVNVEWPEGTTAHMYYGGNFYSADSKGWTVELWEPGVYLENGKWRGNGDIFQLMLCSEPQFNMTNLPTGTYTVGTDYEAGTLMQGYLAGIIQRLSWYYHLINSDPAWKQGPMHAGSCTLTQVGDQIKLEVNVEDDKGFKITGTYTGDWEIFDLTKAPYSMQFARAMNQPHYTECK